MYGVASCLWNLIRKHSIRLALFAVIAVPKNMAGASLLYYEVSHIDINKYAAHAMNFPVMAAISFFTSITLWLIRLLPNREVRRELTKIKLVKSVLAEVRKVTGRFTVIELKVFLLAQCGSLSWREASVSRT